jgi:hypothetical protein
MSKLLHGALVAFLLAGCMGEISVNKTISEIDELYCYGDADTSIVCKDKSEVWTCQTMPNGDEKCVHTPDGEDGWTCQIAGDKLVCTKPAPTGGGAGWDCAYEDGVTTCTSVGTVGAGGSLSGFSPPGGWSDYSCSGGEFGVTCSGTLVPPTTSGGSGSGTSSSGGSGGPIVGAGGAVGGGSGGGDTQPPGTQPPGTQPPGTQPPGTQPPGTQPPDTQPPGAKTTKPKPGEFRSQTPGGWGAPAAGNNAGAYRDKNFAGAFPGGLTIGCSGGHTALFTSAKAIENFLPAGGTPSELDKDYVDPLTTSAGVLAGHVVAMTLAVVFDGYDPNFGSSSMSVNHLVVTSGVCKGMTVAQILQVGNDVVGGCSNLATPSEILSCIDAFNNNFVDGVKSNGYLAYP